MSNGFFYEIHDDGKAPSWAFHWHGHLTSRPTANLFHGREGSNCVLPIMRCAFGAHLDVGLPERPTPCRFVGNLTFPSLFLGEDGHI